MRKLALNGLDEQSITLAGSSSYVLLASSEEQGLQYAMASIAKDEKNIIISEDIERFYAKDPLPLFGWTWSDVNSVCLSFRLNRRYLLQKGGVKRLLEEILFYPQARQSHLIIHLDEELLTSFTFQALTTLFIHVDNFVRQHGNSVLWVLTGEFALTLLDPLRRFNHVVAGLIITTTEAVSQTLFIDYWRHPTGYITKVSCQVTSLSPLTLKIYHKQEVGHFQQFTDQSHVLINRSLVPSNTKLPPNYTIFESNDELYEEAKGKKAATVIFEIDKATDLLRLGEQCLYLRKTAGNWLKIVLKNTDGVIRHKDECIFLTVGVNLILHSATDISRLLSQVQAIQGYKFARPLPQHFNDVVSHAQGSLEKGYLPVFRFIDEVLKHRESSLNTGVSGVLIVLKMQKGLDIESVLPLFKVKRSGDIFTATDKSVYLYLNACRENDVDLALTRLFRLSLGEFFLFHDIYSSELSIEEQCRTLRKMAMNADVTNYSKLIDSSNIADLTKFKPETRTESPPVSSAYNRSSATPITIKLKKDHE
ncbi:protease BcsE [Pseudoalteromonas luteoviolacea B = ATCC 29581]|nr:protease BcsE [Pseudoalteromonas luteoviolacea B = ATCC 29581]